MHGGAAEREIAQFDGAKVPEFLRNPEVARCQVSISQLVLRE